MNKFSIAPAVIAVLAASSADPSFAQTKPNPSSNNKTAIKQNKNEGGTNVGGITGDEGGTNVGGYTPKEGATNVGGSEDGVSIFSLNPWNTGILRVVKRTKQSATDNLADNKMETAIKIYELQLEKISLDAANHPELRLSWTKTIADRTLALAGRMDATIKNQDDRIALFNVYATTYDLIQEFYTLDSRYIIPYNLNKKVKGYVPNTNGLEQELTRYILSQGEWFTKRFISGTGQNGTIPKYSPTVVLVALSSMAKGLAQDILPTEGSDSANGPNLFPHVFEETASLLLGISQDIDEHLAGGSVFGGPDRNDRAINESYKSLMEVMSSIKVN